MELDFFLPPPKLIGNFYGYAMASMRTRDAMEKFGVTYNKDAPVAFRFCAPHVYEAIPNKRNILFTMFESPDLHPNAVARIRKADVIIVPSEFCRRAFQKFTNKPVYTVSLGTERVSYMKRSIEDVSPEKPFRFFYNGAFNPRKGWTFLSQAWEHHFQKIPFVELYLKTTNREPEKQQIYKVGNSIIDGRTIEWEEMQSLYHSAHCFVLPHMGEGWGMTLAEAMSSGAPCITTEYSGVLDFANRQNCYFVPPVVKRMKAELGGDSNADDELFQFAVVDSNKLALVMAQVMDEYQNALVKGHRAAKDLEQFTWERTAAGIVKILRKKA